MWLVFFLFVSFKNASPRPRLLRHLLPVHEEKQPMRPCRNHLYKPSILRLKDPVMGNHLTFSHSLVEGGYFYFVGLQCTFGLHLCSLWYWKPNENIVISSIDHSLHTLLNVILSSNTFSISLYTSIRHCSTGAYRREEGYKGGERLSDYSKWGLQPQPFWQQLHALLLKGMKYLVLNQR